MGENRWLMFVTRNASRKVDKSCFEDLCVCLSDRWGFEVDYLVSVLHRIVQLKITRQFDLFKCIWSKKSRITVQLAFNIFGVIMYWKAQFSLISQNDSYNGFLSFSRSLTPSYLMTPMCIVLEFSAKLDWEFDFPFFLGAMRHSKRIIEVFAVLTTYLFSCRRNYRLLRGLFCFAKLSWVYD